MPVIVILHRQYCDRIACLAVILGKYPKTYHMVAVAERMLSCE